MFLTFEIKVADLSFYTDDWLRKLESTDVIGMDADDLRPLRKINMQLTMFGAPRELTDGGVNGSTVMPYIFPLEAVSTRDGWPSSGNHFDLKMAEDRFQTQGDFSTVYSPLGFCSWYGLPS